MNSNWPTELELLEFFLVEPEKQGAIYFYDISDSRGVNLIFSFDTIMGSIQSMIKIKGVEVATVIMEDVERIWIDDNDAAKPYLRAEFNGDKRIKMNLVILPSKVQDGLN